MEAAPTDGDAKTRNAPPGAALLRAEANFSAPTRVARVGRWVSVTTIKILLVLGLVAGSAYLASPYLPARVVDPVKAWLERLPRRLGLEGPGRPSPTPPSTTF